MENILKTSKYFIACIALLFFFTLSASTVKGRVSNAKNGKGIQYCNVYLQKTANGTVTDVSGYFNLKVADQGEDTLIIKMIGYETKKIPLDFQEENILSIQLETHVLSYNENVFVSATRRAVSIKNTTVSLDVIEREEIEALNTQNIAEALENITSLQIRDYGGIGNMKTISLRGSSAGHVLVMFDGIRINNPQNGEVDLSLIPLDNVERIEILRGGSSAIFGSDAIGGVVNIITNEPENSNYFNLSIKNTFASFNTYALESSISASNSKIGILTTYQYLSSESDFSYITSMGDTSNRENNDIKRHHFFTQINYNPQKLFKGSKFKVEYNFNNAERGAPGTVAYPYPYARMFDKQHDVRFKFSKSSKDLRHTINTQIFYSYDWNHYLNEHPTEILFPSDDSYTTEVIGTEIQFNSVFYPQLILNYGISIHKDIFNNLTREEVYERYSYAAYLVDESVFSFSSKIISTIKITPSLRFNGNNTFADNLSPKIGVLINLGSRDKYSIKGNYGYNYRVPTFNDLYWPADAYTSGNPELEPEFGRDWDIGLNYSTEHINFESMYFDQKLTNLIVWQSQDWIWSPQNVAEARIYGIENSIKIWALNKKIQFSANYTYMNALDLSNGSGENTLLTYRPRHSANIAIVGNIRDISLRFNTTLKGKRYIDSSNTEDLALPAYILNNLSLRYQWQINRIKFDGMVEIKNLFNISYNIMSDLPMPGREFRLSIGTALINKR
jgi:outer membrane receptor for ferrienterochelin and colicins